MSEERKRILEMLAAGKITSEEAELLLDKLEARAGDAGRTEEDTSSRRRDSAPAYFRIVVDSTDGDKVNVRVRQPGIGIRTRGGYVDY